MNLDDLTAFAALDSKNIYAHLNSLPEQFVRAWELGLSGELPAWPAARQVIVAAMGTSAAGAELAAAHLAGCSPSPVVIHRGADLPAWATGPETLLIVSSYTGDTTETLSAFRQGMERGCACLVITTGGALADLAARVGVATWRFSGGSPLGASIGAAFALMLAALARQFGLAIEQEEIDRAVETLHSGRARLNREVPAALNPAKRMGGQLMGRWITIYGEGPLAAGARYWKMQINEFAKAAAACDLLPEADHNSIYAVVNPEDQLPGSLAFFLRAPSESVVIRQRSDATRKFYMLQGITTDFIDAYGETPLANMLSIVQFGDYIAYYLAMAYGIDPTAEPVIAAFKAGLDAEESRSRQ